MENIKLYKSVSEFENDTKVYPHLSYNKETEKVYCYGSEPQNCVYLPCMDTNGLATTFIEGETYEQEFKVFDAIRQMYYEKEEYSYLEGRINIEDKMLTISNGEFFDLSEEPLFVNYLSKLNVNTIDISFNKEFGWSALMFDFEEVSTGWNPANQWFTIDLNTFIYRYVYDGVGGM